jgi:hypothetical protein
MMGERLVMQESLFHAFRLEDHVPCDHLLRLIDRFVDGSLAATAQNLRKLAKLILPTGPQMAQGA